MFSLAIIVLLQCVDPSTCFELPTPRDTRRGGAVTTKRVAAPRRMSSTYSAQRLEPADLSPMEHQQQQQAPPEFSVTEYTAVEKPTATSGGSATISDEVLNLVKTIVGAGILSFPAAVGKCGNHPSILFPVSILMVGVGVAAGYMYSLIGRVCCYKQASSFQEAWSKTMGQKTRILPTFSVLALSFITILAYSMVLGDTTQMLLRSVGLVSVHRTTALLGVTATTLLPLCMLKDLSSLTPFSFVGLMGTLYTILGMGIRLFTKSYATGGKFAADVGATTFGSIGSKGLWSLSTLPLICTITSGYVAHFTAPKFYKELKNNTMERFNKVVTRSFAISAVASLASTWLGFLTFGAGSLGLVLNNYSAKDSLMSLSRLAIAISLGSGYPLCFSGVRDGILDIANVREKDRTNGLLNKITVGILSFVTFFAVLVKDFGLVMALSGATFGNAVMFVFPSLMFRKAVKQMDAPNKRLQLESKLAGGAIGFGVVLSVLGTFLALQGRS